MKLSDIKGDRVFDVIAEIIEPVANIAQDEKITLFTKERPPEGMSARSFMVQKITKNVPLLLKEHKHDISTILATIKGQTVEEYVAGLNLAQLTVDLIELMNDQEFLNFFTSATQTKKQSGSVSGNTEAPEQ